MPSSVPGRCLRPPKTRYSGKARYGASTSASTQAIATSPALAPWAALATDSRKLLAAIDDRFYGGAMPGGVKAALYDALVQIDDAEERARTGLFLATTAFQFQVSR